MPKGAFAHGSWPRVCSVVLAGALAACNSEETDQEEQDGGSPEQYEQLAHNETGPPPASTAQANTYSWDGSWEPSPSEFPIAGMLDETHTELPPGKWGWDNACDCPGDEGLSIYENEFVGKGLDFERLEDPEGHHFGWRLVDTDGGDTTLDHRGDNYDGTPGVDLFDLGTQGRLESTGPNEQSPGINLGDGPDMLRYGQGYGVDLRTGADERGALFDNDLVILGSDQVLATDEYEIEGTTIHTGPGSDLVLCRNLNAAALDLGNGLGGRTDTTDLADGDDLAVLAGNMRDFRIYGGFGDDTIVWFVDEPRASGWLGPNFFGGGGWGDALFGDNGTDRLILAVDPNTEVVGVRSDHDDHPGSLLVFVDPNYQESIDEPTKDDPFARYYGTAPQGPDGQHTLTLSYRSADGSVFTHDFYATAFEELQLGTGDDAQVFRIDPVRGSLQPDSSLQPLVELPERAEFEALFESFGK